MFYSGEDEYNYICVDDSMNMCVYECVYICVIKLFPQTQGPEREPVTGIPHLPHSVIHYTIQEKKSSFTLKKK